jgi:hypothetical protein
MAGYGGVLNRYRQMLSETIVIDGYVRKTEMRAIILNRLRHKDTDSGKIDKQGNIKG